MSDRETISEIAEREAREAEAESPDDAAYQDALVEQAADEGVEDTSAPPAEPPIDFEKAQKALDKEAKRHEQTVARIMGADFEQLHECPLCQIPGFVFPFAAGSEHDEARRAAVEAYMGADGPQLNADPNTETCSTCDGWGELLSKSRHPLHLTKPCTDCGAMGWIQVAARVAPVVPIDPLGYGETTTTPGAVAPAAPDPWGRPSNHRDYGVPPALVNMAG